MRRAADRDALAREIATLRAQLAEAHDALQAIRSGEVDALIVEGQAGPRVFALEGAEHPYRILVEEMSDGAATLSADGAILYCNRRFAALVRAPQERVIGAHLRAFVDPSDADRLADLLASAAVGRADAELAGRAADGTPLILYLSLSPLPPDAVARICVVMVDLTERRSREQALQRAQKMEALGTLAGGIAHDFNNVLLAIDGNARLAMADLDADHPARESLAEITKGTMRATALVKQILAFSRPQKGPRHSRALPSVVADAVRLLRATLPAMVEIRCDFGPAPPVMAEVVELQQIIVNLATNAAHAMAPRGGTLTIEVGSADTADGAAHRRPLTALPSPGRYARLSVRDTGCGMDAATLKRIFDPFFTTKPVGEGTGLGLSIVHNIVKSAGGCVEVESLPGHGSAFHVYLPEGPPEAVEASGATASVAPGGGRHLLYVDDDEALIFLLQRVLRRMGYTVSGFTTPAAALQAFGQEPDTYDAIVTDLAMPGMSGFDLARGILAIRPEVPVVMMSGYVRQDDLGEAARIGIRAVIEKPDSMDELGQALDRVFRAAPVQEPRRSDAAP